MSAPVSRRAVLGLAAGAAGALALPAWARGPAAWRWSGVALGSRASIVIEHRRRDVARDLVRSCLDEVRRLEKTLGKLEKDLAFAARKLENPKFVERAKPDVVAAEREKHERLSEEAGGLRQRLERLRRALGEEA